MPVLLDVIVENVEFGLVSQGVDCHLQAGQQGRIEGLSLRISIKHQCPHTHGMVISILNTQVDYHHIGLQLSVITYQ